MTVITYIEVPLTIPPGFTLTPDRLRVEWRNLTREKVAELRTALNAAVDDLARVVEDKRDG